MKELINKIEKWHKENGIDNLNVFNQMAKTTEEVSEVQKALVKMDHKEIAIEIGDVAVCLIGLIKQLENQACFDFTFEDCLLMAYEKLIGRKGKVIDGMFVKECDLNAN